MQKTLGLLFLLLLSSTAHAALNVFACEPEWAALTQELAGDKASIYTATGPLQDPHQVQASPSLIARARGAQLLVCTGAELEIGWMPVVLQESANSRIQPGSSGHFEAAHYVTMREVPTRLDRADGDVHAEGNPHIQTDARNYLPIADALSKQLIELDPANTAFYQQRYAAFNQQWRAAIAKWEKDSGPAQGHIDRGSSQGISLHERLAGTQGSGRTGTQARHGAQRVLSGNRAE